MQLRKSIRTQFAFAFFTLQLLTAGFAQAHVDAVIGDTDIHSNANLPGFMPATQAEEIIISRKQFVISYNKSRREPNWVAWKVEQSDLGKVGRSNNFQVDTELQAELARTPGALPAVDPAEYKGSCFDRGHQSPSGDHTATPTDNRATFVMSNMIPQTAYLNRVIWEHLEQHTRDLVLKSNKKVYVVAGPIYDQDFGAIGPKKDIPVPSKNFKMVIVLDAGQSASDISSATPVISVIMPNALADGSAPTNHAALCNYLEPQGASTDDWQKYQTSVDEIERLSGVTLH